MAKVGLAAQLAKQAAQAAREEVAQTEGSASSAKAVPAAGTRWSVPTLPDGFDLTQAMGEATRQVVSYYHQALAPEGIRLGVTQTQQQGNPVEAGADVVLREGETGRVVRAYTQADFLTLFATQRQATGVVVDGQV